MLTQGVSRSFKGNRTSHSTHRVQEPLAFVVSRHRLAAAAEALGPSVSGRVSVCGGMETRAGARAGTGAGAAAALQATGHGVRWAAQQENSTGFTHLTQQGQEEGKSVMKMLCIQTQPFSLCHYDVTVTSSVCHTSQFPPSSSTHCHCSINTESHLSLTIKQAQSFFIFSLRLQLVDNLSSISLSFILSPWLRIPPPASGLGGSRWSQGLCPAVLTTPPHHRAAPAVCPGNQRHTHTHSQH